MSDLREKGAKIPFNPHAAALANKYVPEILALIRGSRHAGETLGNTGGNAPVQEEKPFQANFQELEKEWELDEEDLKALEELPV